MRTLLFDGDIFAYRTASVHEKVIHWDDNISSLHSQREEAEAHLYDQIIRIQDALDADALVIAMTDAQHNFRKDILPTYKSNRKGVRKPLLLEHLKDFMRTTFDTYDRPTLEADDIMGILSTGAKISGEKIIVSADKDLRGIPGKLYNDAKPELGVQEISEEQADYWHMVQTLTGDVTDGYAGCPGVGAVKAEKILFGVSPPWGHISEVWPSIVSAYEKAGLNEAEALRQARVARILRASDYDFKNKRVIPWTPH